jgi:murein DD-endopeptidase MepM/ murein hydrolase activator NlpD
VGVGWDGYVDPADTGPPSGIPLVGNVYITCDFHDPLYTSHTGVDLVLWPETTFGAPIYTTMAGKVVWAGWNGPWGNLVVVENGGYQVWFAHLSEIHVLEGDNVASDEIVGLVGSTGNSTGPHLHYGIKMKVNDGQVWLDPLDYFGGDEYGWAVCG